MSNTANPSKITIGPVRFSYCFLNEPRPSDKEGVKPKYETSIIISKDDKKSLKLVQDAIEAAKNRGKADLWKNKIPAAYKESFYAGDEKDDEDPAYKNAMYLTARATRKPQIVDKKLQPIIDADAIYSGMYGYVSLEAYPYDNEGKGVAFSLGNVMKTKDGERLGGGSTAEQDFADLVIADDEDDLM